MTKFFFPFVVLTLGFFSTYGQSVYLSEAGMRFGNDISFEATLPLATAPRLHPALYLNENGVIVASYFDWMFGIADGPEGLRIHPGVGPELYFIDDVALGIAGNFGVEYAFEFPMSIGFDWRPAIVLGNDDNLIMDNWGISARYRFR
ncbi:MAG: hypothetical protein KI790_02660 [Cyclobacteriaceae bacterium]|nr:hypothetical protein [Cyclobacteriaceae bacterium HetDA_MAG_MS6]